MTTTATVDQSLFVKFNDRIAKAEEVFAKAQQMRDDAFLALVRLTIQRDTLFMVTGDKSVLG